MNKHNFFFYFSSFWGHQTFLFILATSGITSPSMAQKGGSYKGASIKAHLLLQGLNGEGIGNA
jgi:hypothetical protein